MGPLPNVLESCEARAVFGLQGSQSLRWCGPALAFTAGSTFTRKFGCFFLGLDLKHGDPENVSSTAFRLTWPPLSIEIIVSSSRTSADEDMLVELNTERGRR